MAGTSKWYSIIVAPHDRTDSWKVRVPGWGLWAFVVFCGLSVTAMIVLGFVIQQYRETADLVEHLSVENQRLVEANEKIVALEEEITALSDFHHRVREWVGLPPDTTRLSGSTDSGGGMVTLASTLLYAGGSFGGGWEWPARGWISRGFHPGSGEAPGHFGIDIVAAKDEPVRAARSGTVTFSGWDDRFGNLVIIRHDDQYESHYGHNAELLVHEGDAVIAGQEIGIIGSTGLSSAPHLHFEIRKEGQPIEPMGVLTTP